MVAFGKCDFFFLKFNLLFQRSVDDFSAILEEAILAHSLGAVDAKSCGEKVLCDIFLPKESLETPPPFSNSLRHLVREKFRYSSLQSTDNFSF